MINIFTDGKIQSAVRTVLQMGGAVLVTYGVVSAEDLQTAASQVETVIGGLAALAGLVGLFVAKRK